MKLVIRTGDPGARILALMSAALLVLAQIIWFMPLAGQAETAGEELVVRVQYYGEIGDKIREKARFSREDLEVMGAETYYYSNITRVGTVMSMAAYGPEVLTIIEAAGIDTGSVGNITFRTTDGYTRNFTIDRHLRAEKYYYPELASNYERNEEGTALTPMEGALDGKAVVPAILALEFGESKKAGVHAEELEMSRDRSYRFCMGQSDLEEGRMTDPSDGGGDISSMESCHSIYGIDVTLTGSPIHGISLDLDGTDIKVGSKKRISVYIDVDEAFEGAFTAEDIKWSSSDKSIATVDKNGNVTVHKKGSVVITATAPDGTTAQIVINGTGGSDKSDKKEEKKDSSAAKDKKDKDSGRDGSDKAKAAGTAVSRDDGNGPDAKVKDDAADEPKETVTAEEINANEVTFRAREIVLGDVVVEKVSPQDAMRGKMAEDAAALTEARTYSRGAAAGTAAAAGMLCGAGALSRAIRYRREFGAIAG